MPIVTINLNFNNLMIYYLKNTSFKHNHKFQLGHMAIHIGATLSQLFQIQKNPHTAGFL
ncbi:hypothetical protein HVMH_1924 [Hydrogenovibrio marinus]|nr:hypothetical protein HVMH_1924 [Hydrogenovibrio marinus]